jgi:hypothetical protein
MPPDHDEARARQLEALRRYVAELGVQHEHPTVEDAKPPPAVERQRRPSLPWLLLTGLLVTLALVGGVVVGAVAWSDDRPAGAEAGFAGASSPTQSPNTTTATPSSNATTVALVASPACKTAVDRANRMLTIAVRLQGALAEYSRILNDRSNGRLSGREVLERTAPELRAGASESARFNQALADYRQVVDQCKLQTP